MKAGTLLIIIGILMVIVIHTITIAQKIYPTYSLIYLLSGIIIGAGITSNMNG